MNKLDIYDIEYLDYYKKDGVMKYVSAGVVKSEKFFPMYGNKIFKPLSRTKPYTTPLFAYSEVFWSYYINNFFDKSTPRYFLAKCSNIEKDFPKYYELGTLVEKVTSHNQKLINLLEYFNENPDLNVNIKDYVNYCEKIYDYTKILDAKIFEEREDLRHQIEEQILLSIMRQDENFHYENISFVIEEGKILSICPPLDLEFSLVFLYPDDLKKRNARKITHSNSLSIPLGIPSGSEKSIFDVYSFYLKTNLKNILAIAKRDINLIVSFKEKLLFLIDEIETTDILFVNNGYFDKLNSKNWEIGHARYKGLDEEMAQTLEQSIEMKNIDSLAFNNMLKRDCLDSLKNMYFVLESIVYLYQSGSDLIYPTIKDLFELKGIDISREEFENMDIDDKINSVFGNIKKYINKL